LIAQGIGGPFDAGKGKPMKEWVVVSIDDEHTWFALAEESRTLSAPPHADDSDDRSCRTGR